MTANITSNSLQISNYVPPPIFDWDEVRHTSRYPKNFIMIRAIVHDGVTSPHNTTGSTELSTSTGMLKVETNEATKSMSPESREKFVVTEYFANLRESRTLVMRKYSLGGMGGKSKEWNVHYLTNDDIAEMVGAQVAGF
jgi:hypothetical protein